MSYQGGVDFEDEGRVRIEKKSPEGLLFRILKKLHLARTDKEASLWAFGILVIVLFLGVRIFMTRERTVTLDKNGPKPTVDQILEYNKIQPFDYETAIKDLQQ
ncbi:MAG: hypothetical protein G01um101448_954 [Parcubacteria group bacterium Gr01-1014_48]|nr:MAG: hypothetical protein Greene041614_1034 [Parcubacteria group bacterium Greene0416_14]TSC72555.1 MAG: hypothetical protein G01um101448_954 [Parcubacteria group bacterium Gr01-1014_48]TSD01332.1 MAG: hypothetical protein Greene101415_346 [Parcubacteria group bacterium Greene1014_15]TSD08020.1 MAG: hypothetical protein Greene07144_508 [Parcubacteria group bacterium Greene0714_4]